MINKEQSETQRKPPRIETDDSGDLRSSLWLDSNSKSKSKSRKGLEELKNKILKDPVSQKNGDLLYELARSYQKISNCKKSASTAFQLFEQAARLGNTKAMRHVINILSDKQDYAQAIYWTEQLHWRSKENLWTSIKKIVSWCNANDAEETLDLLWPHLLDGQQFYEETLIMLQKYCKQKVFEKILSQKPACSLARLKESLDSHPIAKIVGNVKLVAFLTKRDFIDYSKIFARAHLLEKNNTNSDYLGKLPLEILSMIGQLALDRGNSISLKVSDFLNQIDLEKNKYQFVLQLNDELGKYVGKKSTLKTGSTEKPAYQKTGKKMPGRLLKLQKELSNLSPQSSISELDDRFDFSIKFLKSTRKKANIFKNSLFSDKAKAFADRKLQEGSSMGLI